MDEDVVHRAFQMAPPGSQADRETIQDKLYVHDTDETIGSFGSDPDRSVRPGRRRRADDQKHLIDRTATTFAPVA